MVILLDIASASVFLLCLIVWAEARGELDEVSSTGVGVALGESAPGLGPLAELGAREGCESLDGPSWGCI